MIDLEETGLRGFRQAVGTTIEAGAQQYDLSAAAAQLFADHFVDKAGAGDARRAATRPAAIDEMGNRPSKWRHTCQRRNGPQGWTQKAARPGIVEEADSRAAGCFQGAEEGHVFGRAAVVGRVHGLEIERTFV